VMDGLSPADAAVVARALTEVSDRIEKGHTS